jgi:hypothetical protein
MVVGAFPGLSDLKRRTIRAPINQMDKSTVVSIFPKPIDERKHTIQPGIFQLEPGSYEKPSLLIVGPSSWWKELDEEQPLLEIPVSSILIADSIVKDYCNGILACNMGDTMPGLFYLPGEWTVEKIKKEKIGELNKAQLSQRNWFKVLVKIADTLWARTNGNPLVISDDMRLAARELNLESGKEWTKDTQTMELIRCVACGTLGNPNFPVCATCKAIKNMEQAKMLGLKFSVT